MSSIKCPNCRLNNFPGTLECRRCNQSLVGVPALDMQTSTAAPYHSPAATAVVERVKEKRLAPSVIIPVTAILALMAAFGGLREPSSTAALKAYVLTAESSICALYLLGLVFVVWGPKKRPLGELDREWETRPSRIDGCLVIPATALLVNVAVRALAVNGALQLLPKLQPITVLRNGTAEQFDINWLVTAELCANALIAIFSMMLMGDYFKRHARLPKLVIALFVVEVFWGLMDISLAASATSGVKVMTRTGLRPLSDLIEQQAGSLGWLYLLLFLLNRAAGISYFLVSKRVKATFAPDDDDLLV
ncbi:MAG TPA: DUF2569 family protein [Blastocatellia bacterium]|nr:DUF2569 family protein [Blastocatellia bacterium]